MPRYTLRPNAIGDFDNWTLGAGGDKFTAVDPGDYPGVDDSDASYVVIGTSPGGASKQSFKFGGRPKLASVASFNYQVWARQETGGPGDESIFVIARMDGVEGTPVSISPGSGSGYIEFLGAIPRPGGGDWSVADIENPDLQIVIDVPSDNAAVARVSESAFFVDGTPAEVGVGREIGTAYMRIVRRPVRFTDLDVEPEILDVEIMDDVSLTHYAHPLTRILGYRDEMGIWRPGLETWQRVLTQHREIQTDLNTFVSRISLRDRRWDLVTFYDSAESQRTLANIEDGVAILTWGGARVYTRPSLAWIEDPGSGLVVVLASNQRPIGLGGFQPESFSAQLLKRSSAVDGATDITSTGDGTLTAEASPPTPVFDEDVTPNAFLFTAGSPHTSDNIAEWPESASPPSNATLRLSVDHLDDVGATLEWQMERTSDNEFFDDTSGDWDAANVWNELTVRTTKFRDKSLFKIPLDAADSVIFRMRQASGGTSARLNRVYHVQLENNGVGHVTSRIVTDEFDRARELQLYEVQETGFNNTHGTFFCEFVPFWNAVDMNVTANFPSFFEVQYIGDTFFRDGWLLYYNGTAENTLTFECRVDNVAYTVNIPFTPVAGTLYQVMVRWLPLDVAAFGHLAGAISVFVGEPGAIAAAHDVRPANPDKSPGEDNERHMYVGTSPVATSVNGVMRRIYFTQQIFSDAEIQAGQW
jgi:hypothetical protein